jgi:Ulp1 family protease
MPTNASKAGPQTEKLTLIYFQRNSLWCPFMTGTSICSHIRSASSLHVSPHSHWYLAIIYRPELILPYHQISPSSPKPHESDESQDISIEAASSIGPRTIVYILDSLGGCHPSVTLRLSDYLKREAYAKQQCSNTSSVIERHVKVSPFPTQCNPIDFSH